MKIGKSNKENIIVTFGDGVILGHPACQHSVFTQTVNLRQGFNSLQINIIGKINEIV